MRFLALALSVMTAGGVTAACAQSGAHVRSEAEAGDDRDGVPTSARANVAGARQLDQEGVRSFREGRYSDAVRYFQGAFRLGGPSSELWNVARSLERLDDPEGATRTIERYLGQRDLSVQDRADAEREARVLRARPSVLTVATTPAGASVTVDGKPTAGVTPLSVDIAAGMHSVAVRIDGYLPESRSLEARFGRAVIVSLDLARRHN
jgi:PEGA domain